MKALAQKTSSVLQTNKTLQNTFLLLTATLFPTIFGAWFGMVSGFNAVVAASPIMSLILLFVVMAGLIFAIHATSDSWIGVAFLLLFTFLMGLMLSTSIETILDIKNGHMIVTQAIIGTAIATFSCAVYAMTTEKDFSSWGGMLMAILLGMIAVSLLNLWLQLPFLTLILSIAGLILFSVYLIYDVQQVVNGGETNYVTATLAIYLDIINIFVNLLQILLSLSDD